MSEHSRGHEPTTPSDRLAPLPENSPTRPDRRSTEPSSTGLRPAGAPHRPPNALGPFITEGVE